MGSINMAPRVCTCICQSFLLLVTLLLLLPQTMQYIAALKLSNFLKTFKKCYRSAVKSQLTGNDLLPSDHKIVEIITTFTELIPALSSTFLAIGLLPIDDSVCACAKQKLSLSHAEGIDCIFFGLFW